MHTALIRRVAVEPTHERLVTASDDKTLRFWRIADGRLERTLRVPIDKEHEGQLFALALSPDGQLVAAGGWTCWDWETTSCVYVMRVSDGELVRRIRGLPDAVGALAWSPDGAHLAVGLQGRAGVRIYRTGDYAEVARDTAFNDKVMELAYDRKGRLAAVAFDGFARLYTAQHRLHARARIAGGAKPASVRFSPDGSTLAIGFIDAAAVALVSGADLTPQGLREAPRDAAQASFSSVAWSADGEFLLAAGERGAAQGNVIWRWSRRGTGPATSIAVPAQRVSELQALPQGAIAFAAEDPRIGVLDRDGKLVLDRGPDVVDFSRGDVELVVAADASVVGLRTSTGQAPMRPFSIATQEGAAGSSVALEAPRRVAEGWRVERWRGSFKPSINGRTPELDDYEIARSFAIAHDGESLLLGTEWAIRLLDRNARERWRVKLPAIAWAVNISRGGQLAIAALSDGTIRWYRMSDGAELLAYFPHANGEDWIAWVPSGYYMSSPHGDQFVGWHMNRGADAAPDFYRAVQFERVLYRPDIVMASLSTASRATTRGTASTSAAGATFDVSRLREITPPRLRVEVMRLPNAAGDAPTARIRVRAERTAVPMRDLTVFVNDVPVTPHAERVLAERETDRFEREIDVPLFAAENEIRVESFTGASMGIGEAFASAPPRSKAAAVGDLYVLAIGNNRFPGLSPATQLEFAARDAEEFARAMERSAAGVFRRVQVHLLADSQARQADRTSILEAVSFLKHARAEDTVVVFLASHGISDKAGNYYFVPRDALAADMESIARDPARPGGYESLVPWTVFFDALRDAAGRRVLIVDTCQARGIEGRFEPYSLMKRSASSRFSLMVAAKADEESQEYEPARHGLFTYALLQSLSPAGDADGDGRISVRELFDAAKPIVEKLYDRATGPQTPQIVTPRSLEASTLGAARATTAAAASPASGPSH